MLCHVVPRTGWDESAGEIIPLNLKGGAARAAARALHAASFPSCAPRGRRVFPRFDPDRHGPLHPVQIGPKPKNAHPFGREGTTPHHYM